MEPIPLGFYGTHFTRMLFASRSRGDTGLRRTKGDLTVDRAGERHGGRGGCERPAGPVHIIGDVSAGNDRWPLAKTGGLADVCAALPAAISGLGIHIRVMIPGYPGALDTMLEQRVITELRGSFPDGRRLIAGVSPIAALPVIMFDRPSLFGRDGGRRGTAMQPHQR
jgi:hypothetical protein